MKKYIILTILLYLCTGCSKIQVLNCTKNKSDNTLAMEESMKLEIKNNKVNLLNIDIKFGLDGNYLEHKDVVKSNIDEITNAYQNQEGIQVSNLEDGDSILVDLVIDYSKFNGNVTNDIFNVNKYNVDSINIDNIKAHLESEGYSCSTSDK